MPEGPKVSSGNDAVPTSTTSAPGSGVPPDEQPIPKIPTKPRHNAVKQMRRIFIPNLPIDVTTEQLAQCHIQGDAQNRPMQPATPRIIFRHVGRRDLSISARTRVNRRYCPTSHAVETLAVRAACKSLQLHIAQTVQHSKGAPNINVDCARPHRLSRTHKTATIARGPDVSSGALESYNRHST